MNEDNKCFQMISQPSSVFQLNISQYLRPKFFSQTVVPVLYRYVLYDVLYIFQHSGVFCTTNIRPSVSDFRLIEYCVQCKCETFEEHYFRCAEKCFPSGEKNTYDIVQPICPTCAPFPYYIESKVRKTRTSTGWKGKISCHLTTTMRSTFFRRTFVCFVVFFCECVREFFFFRFSFVCFLFTSRTRVRKEKYALPVHVFTRKQRVEERRATKREGERKDVVRYREGEGLAQNGKRNASSILLYARLKYIFIYTYMLCFRASRNTSAERLCEKNRIPLITFSRMILRVQGRHRGESQYARVPFLYILSSISFLPRNNRWCRSSYSIVF